MQPTNQSRSPPSPAPPQIPCICHSPMAHAEAARAHTTRTRASGIDEVQRNQIVFLPFAPGRQATMRATVYVTGHTSTRVAHGRVARTLSCVDFPAQTRGWVWLIGYTFHLVPLHRPRLPSFALTSGKHCALRQARAYLIPCATPRVQGRLRGQPLRALVKSQAPKVNEKDTTAVVPSSASVVPKNQG